MSRYKFSLATAIDDAALRERMTNDIMPGKISVSFRREPNYFNATEVQGTDAEIIKCTDTHTTQIVGLGARLKTTAYLNGRKSSLGYLSDLRSNSEVRGKLLLARGYSYLRKLHEANPVDLYYTMILGGNEKALDILTSGRAGLPQYHNHGQILTPAIPLSFAKPAIKIPSVSFAKALPEQMTKVFEFINSEQSKKQFAPSYDVNQLNTNRLRGLKAGDFYLAIKENEIVGVIACWDQQKFRQTHIEKYSLPLRLMRPLNNGLAKFSPLRALPNAGSSIPYFYLFGISLKNNDPKLFRALLREVYNDRRTGNWHYFIAGLHEDDPLAQVLQEYGGFSASGNLFIVNYPDGEVAYAALDKRVPFIEIAAV